MTSNEKREKLKRFLMIFLPFFIISMWIATQSVASDCHYDDILGIGLPVLGIKIYAPWMFFVWKSKFLIVIPTIILSAQKYIVIGGLIGFLLGIFIVKKMQELTGYGTAKWATSKEIKEAGLNGNKGVMLGIHPYKFHGYNDKNIGNKLLYDDGPAHIGLFAPTRSGKGASIIVNTCLLWKHSLVVLDLKGENFNFTASFRKKGLKNKVIKFEPFCTDETGAKWNPIAEIRMGTDREISDVMGLARQIADPTGKGGEKGDSHWIDTSAALIQTVILHLLYVRKRQDLPIPTLSDVSVFLSSTSMPFDEAIDEMQHFAHISTKDFFNNNVFQKIYGNYIESNFEIFNAGLKDSGVEIDTAKLKQIKYKFLDEEIERIKLKYEALKMKLPDNDVSKFRRKKIDKDCIKKIETLKEQTSELIEKYSNQFRDIREIQEYYRDEFEKNNLDFETFHKSEGSPFSILLTHPRVADGAAECANRDPKEQGSVLSSANAKFNLYRDPIVAKNTSISQFVSTDLMIPNQPVTVYLVIPPNKVQDAIPLIRIFLNYLLDRNTESMNFKAQNNSNKKEKAQRCLLLLDEFPQLGKIEKMETAMAITAGYGLKMLFVAQDINQINKNYGENNSIISNCHVRIFFTPNDFKTAESISKTLGTKTINVVNKSEAGAFKSNLSYNQAARELFKPDEILKLSSDEEIIFIAGLPPIKAKKAWYFKIPFFMRRCKNDSYPEAIESNLKSDTVTVIDNYKTMTEMYTPTINKNEHRNETEKTIDFETKILNDINVSEVKDMTIDNDFKDIPTEQKMKSESEETTSAITTPLNNIIGNINDDDPLDTTKIPTDKNLETENKHEEDKSIEIDDFIKKYEGLKLDNDKEDEKIEEPIIEPDNKDSIQENNIEPLDLDKDEQDSIETSDEAVEDIPEYQTQYIEPTDIKTDIDNKNNENIKDIMKDINSIDTEVNNSINEMTDIENEEVSDNNIENILINIIKERYQFTHEQAIEFLKLMDDSSIEFKSKIQKQQEEQQKEEEEVNKAREEALKNKINETVTKLKKYNNILAQVA